MYSVSQPITPPTLRPYQKQVIAGIYHHIRNGEKRILVVAATGSGKTLVASQIVAHAASRGKRILFVVHRDILVKQTASKFQQFGVECGFIKAGWQENRDSLVQIASVQTNLEKGLHQLSFVLLKTGAAVLSCTLFKWFVRDVAIILKFGG
jgi:superfamily II DNA or RNA helicase